MGTFAGEIDRAVGMSACVLGVRDGLTPPPPQAVTKAAIAIKAIDRTPNGENRLRKCKANSEPKVLWRNLAVSQISPAVGRPSHVTVAELRGRQNRSGAEAGE